MLFIASSILYPNFFYQAKYVHFWVNTHVWLYFDLYVLYTKLDGVGPVDNRPSTD